MSSQGSEAVGGASGHRVLVGSAFEDRQKAAVDWLQSVHESSSAAHTPLLVATQRGAADDLVRRLAGQRAGLLDIERVTPRQLASRVAALALAQEGRVAVGSTASLAVVTRVARQAADDGRLRRLGEVADLGGFPRALARTLADLRGAGVRVEDLRALEQREVSQAEPAAPERLPPSRGGLRLVAGTSTEAARPTHESPGGLWHDLALLLEGYEEQLVSWGLADASDRLRVGAEVLRAPPAWVRQLVERPQIWLDVPVRTTGDRDFLSALAGAARGGVCWTVLGDDDETDREVETVLAGEATLRIDLDRTGGAAATEDSAAPVRSKGTQTLLQRTQRYVFEAEVPSSEELAHEDESFIFFSAAGEGRECIEIARRIRDLAAQGRRYDQIAVAVRQPTTYLPLLEEAFRRAEIPAWFAHGLSRPDPAGRALLSLLACAAEGLSASAFAEYLSLGQVPQLEGDGRPPERIVPWVEPRGDQMVLRTLLGVGELSQGDPALEPQFEAESVEVGGQSTVPSDTPEPDALPAPARWQKFLVDAAVVGGSARWRRRLAGLQEEWRRQVQRLDGVEEESGRRRRKERDLSQLENLQRFALPLIEQLEQLPEGGTWGEWLRALERLATASLRRPGTVLSALAELRPMSDVAHVNLAQVQQVLAEPLGFLRAEPQPRRYGRVFVGTVEELAARSFEVVFVPGLAEGVFPRRVFEDPLLLDRARRELENQAMTAGRPTRLATRAVHSHRERLLLRTAIGGAVEQLVVSYPRVDLAQGRARVPSFYALDLLRAASGRLPDLAELGKRAARANASRIGWPSPTDPGVSVDRSEFDLARLRAALAARERGGARFLMEEPGNDHLVRGLHARARRWRAKWTWADGLVARQEDDPAKSSQGRLELTRELLAEHLPERRSFSPTALQHFAQCPYRFLLQAVHRLRPQLDVAGFERLDPLTRGSLFHDVQFELIQELRREGLVPIDLNRLPEVISRCDAVLDRVAARYEEDLAPAIPRVWRGEVETLRNDLRGWLRQRAEEPQWTPVANELAFGLPGSAGRDASSWTEPVVVDDLGGARLRGSIDLVEVDRSGRRIRVVDHKTGRPPQERHLVIAGGKILQPVLYALAAEQMLGAGPPDDESGPVQEEPAEPVGDVEATDSAAVPSEDRSLRRRIEEAFGVTLESGAFEALDDLEDPADRAIGGRPESDSEGQKTGQAGATGGERRVVEGRLHYCTQRGGFEVREVAIQSDARRAAADVVERVREGLRQGFLPAAPVEGACRWCDYRPVCGPYEELRVQRKRSRDLEALTRLRRLP